jgi:hypothetical protein
MYVLYLFFVNTVHYRRKQICIEGLISQGHLLGHPSQTSQIITSLQAPPPGCHGPAVSWINLTFKEAFNERCLILDTDYLVSLV